MNNNRTKVIYKNQYDRVYERQLQKNVSDNKRNQLKNEIQDTFNEIFKPQTYVGYGKNNDILVSSSMKFRNEKTKKDETAINRVLDILEQDKFFEIITTGTQKGTNLINKTIDYNNRLNYSNQKVKSNASLSSVKEAYQNLVQIIENKGKLHVYDLETIGGDNRLGIWNPLGITEFSAHTTNFADNKVYKTDVFLGMDDKSSSDLEERIIKAIQMGTLDKDGDLAVTAMRMSMYGNEKTVIKKNDKGFFEVVSFVDAKEADQTNVELIKKGFEKHRYAYNNTDIVDGLRVSEKTVLDKIAEIQTDLINKNGMLAGFNHTKFDNPITNKYLSDIVIHNKNILTNSVDPVEKQNALTTLKYYNKIFNLDNGGKAVLSPTADQTFDMRAAVDLFKGYYGIDALYAGKKDYVNVGPQMARQEHIAKAHFATLMEKGNAHQASFDVEMLTQLFLGKSEVTGTNFLDYLMNGDGQNIKGINNIDEISTKISVGTQLFKAKSTSINTSFSKQGHLNFVHDRKTNMFYTADGRIIGEKNRDKVSFDLGAKLNKGQFYTVGGIQKIDATGEWGELMAQTFPELATQDLYSIRLDIQTPEEYGSTAIGNTSRYFFFKSQSELEAFVSSNLTLVAEHDEDGKFKILRDRKEVKKELEIRKLKHNKNGTTGMVLEKDFWDLSDEEIINRNLKTNVEKLLTSRAENAVLGYNSYKRTNQLLKINNLIEDKKIGSITGLELSQIMSGQVVSEKILGKIDKNGLSELQKQIINIAANKNGDLYPTTQTSLAISYDLIAKQSDAIKMIQEGIEGLSKTHNIDDTGKQILFDNILKNLKMEHATEYYKGSPEKIRDAILNNKDALMATSEIMNYYEVNLPGFSIHNKPVVADMINPTSTKDLFRINLDSGKEYDLINKLIKAKFGDTDINPNHKDTYAIDVLSDFMKRIDGQMPGKKNKTYSHYNGLRSLSKEMEDVRNKKTELNPYEFSTRLLGEFRKIKELNPVAGIINTNTTMSALIHFDEKLISDFNSYITPEKVQEAISKAPKVLNFKDEQSINDYVKNTLIKYYMPDKDELLKTLGDKSEIQKKTMLSLYDKHSEGHIKNLKDIITAAVKADTAISVQDDGTLMLMKNGEYTVLDRIAKTKIHKDSGILYDQVGMQKIVAHHKLGVNGKTAKVKLTTTLEDVSSAGNIVKYLYRMSENKDIKLSDLEYAQKSISKKLIENSSLQSFNRHDIKSNYRFSFEDIKKIIPQLFNEGGSLSSIVENIELNGGFRDRTLVETMRHLIGGREELDELSPAMKHNLLKNINDLVLSVADPADHELKEFVKHTNNSSKETQVSDMTGHIGDRYKGNAVTSLDNNARPTVAQSGRGYYIRESDIDKAIKDNSDKVLFKGSLITSETNEKEIFRNIYGIGDATTSISFRRTFVGSNSLKVILDTKMDEVIENAKVNNMTKNQVAKLYAHLYDSINTFEQEKHMDSRIFEQVYGRAADIQRLSTGADIIKPLEAKGTLSKAEAENYKKLIDMIGHIELEDENLVYKKDVGKIVKKGDKLIEYASFGDTTKTWTSKMNEGVLNYGFFSSTSKMALTEEEITKIINENKSLFMKDGKLLDEKSLKGNLIELFKEKDFVSQYFIEDINRLAYGKTMDDEVEKGMTRVGYAKVGSSDENVASFFKNIGKGHYVKNTILTDEAFNAVIAETDKGKLNEALAKSGFHSVDDVVKAMYHERHAPSKLIYDYIFPGTTELANDALFKHGNKGSMMTGAFSELVMSVANHNNYGTSNEGRAKAIEDIFNFMNKDSKYDFLGNITLDKKVSREKLKLQQKNGYVKLLEDLSAGSTSFGDIDHEALTNLIVDMEKHYGFEGENKLVHDGVTLLTKYKDGKFEYEKNQRYIGRATFGDVVANTNNGTEKLTKTLLTTSSIITNQLMEDPETQTSISQAYFDRKLEIVKLKKQYAIDRDPNIFAQIQKAERELSGFSDVVKQMGITDQEITIMEMSELNEASQTVIDKLKNDDFLKSDAFKGVIETKDGKSYLSSEFKNKKLLKNFTDQFRDLALYDHTSEIELTQDLLQTKEYAHLKEQYDIANLHGRKIGVETAEKLHNLKLANLAYEFDSSIAPLKDAEKLLNEGFNYMHINDFVSNYGKKSDIIESIANKHLLIDLGEEFGPKSHIALPGLGSLIGDGEVKADYQSKLFALSNDIQNYNNLKNKYGIDSDKTKEAFAEAEKRAEQIRDLVSDIYKKNGPMHTAAKVFAPTPSYRLKASGADGEYLNGALHASDIVDRWGVKNQTALATAEINGKTIMEWEKEGKYYDYKFMSKDQFVSMGYYKPEFMEKLGIKTEEEMTEYLKKHGTMDISGRYPNIMSTSMVTTRAYLDETLVSNQAKFSRVTTLKYNGDFDGDSTSAFLLRARSIDENGEYIYEDYAQYQRARQLAKEALGEDADEADIKRLATTSSKVKVTETTYDTFKGIDAGMSLDAAGDNLSWARKVEETMAKDSIKTAENLNISKISAVEDGKSILGKKQFTQLSEVVDLKTFNENEKAVNEGLALIKSLGGTDYGTVRDFSDIGKGLDSALVEMENLLSNDGSMSKESKAIFDKFEAEAVKRYRIEKYDQEVMSKGSKGIIGAANISLNATKLASEAIYAEGPDKDMFKHNLIWKVNYLKEQDPISGKKLVLGYDENRIAEYADISRKLFNSGSGKTKEMNEAQEEMRAWMDKYIGNKEAFAEFYDQNVDTYIPKHEHKKILKADDVTFAKYAYVREEYIKSVSELSQNEMAQSYLAMFNSFGKAGDKYNLRMNSTMASSNQDTITGIIMSQLKPETIERGVQESQIHNSSREAINRAKQSRYVQDENLALKTISNTTTSMSNEVGNFIGDLMNSSSGGNKLATFALGTAAGLMVSGFASGNPLKDVNSDTMIQEEGSKPKSIPQFLDEQGGYVTGNSQQGYIINIKADSKKGRKHMERALKQAAEASVGGAVNVNMNIRNSKANGFSDKDIERYIESHL